MVRFAGLFQLGETARSISRELQVNLLARDSDLIKKFVSSG